MADTSAPSVEQELFCCALVKGNGPKVKWLHTTCHDYWERLGEANEQVAALRAETERLRAIELAAHAWVDAVEASEDDGEDSAEYIDAAHGLVVALGRQKAIRA